MLQLPRDITGKDGRHRQIGFDDIVIVESCMYEKERTDSALVYQHELIYILKGQLEVRSGDERVLVKENEILLLKKGTYFDLVKRAVGAEIAYESILFFIHDDFILDFFKFYELSLDGVAQPDHTFFLMPGNGMIHSYMQSLIPYFGSGLSTDKSFIRLKTFELLFNLAETNAGLLRTLAGLTRYPVKDITSIMEDNYLRDLTIEDYALMCNRSVSAFKRDFEAIYKTSPYKWVVEKRLQLAFSFLKNGLKRPNEVYMEVGYNDLSHFSRAFKKRFGLLPSEVVRIMN